MLDLNIQKLVKIKKRNIYTCFAVALLYGFGEGGFFVVLQPILLEITGSLFAVGLIMTTVSFVQVIIMPWIGKLMDNFGKKRLWLIGNPIIIIGCFILIMASDIIFAGMAVIMIYVGGVIYRMSSQMIISESSDNSKKGFNFSFVFFASSGASIFGFMLVLFDIGINYHFYIWIFIVMNLLIWLIVFSTLSPISSKFIKKQERNSMGTKPKQNTLFELLRTPKTRIILIFFTLNWFFYGITSTIWNAWFIDTYGVNVQALALFFLVANIFRMIFQIPSGHIIDKIGKKKALVISLICCIISSFISIFVFFTWSSGLVSILIPGYIMAIIFFTMYITIVFPVESIYLTNLTEEKKAESFGTVKLITDGALIPTGVIGGSIADFVHPIAPEIIHLGGFILLLWFPIRSFNGMNHERVDDS